MARGWLRAALLAPVIGAAGYALLAHATGPFDPSLSLFLTNPGTSANSDLRSVAQVPAGSLTMSTWSVFLPSGWGVQGDGQVTDGDATARGTMSVDTDCDGSVNTYGPFNLVDTATSPPDAPVAQWSGMINSWWSLLVTVDQDPGEPLYLSGDLINISQPHTFCAPETFILTVLGRSTPHNEAVLTNPSSSGSHTFTGSFVSAGGGYAANTPVAVCVGNSCDNDGDGVPSISDNCDTWPNPAQTLPPWTVPADDPDCDGFSSTVEDAAGTHALIQCGVNAWPADIGNDTFSDISDISVLAGAFGASAPPAPARYNIAPNPPDAFVDITDISLLASLFGKSCAPCPSDLDCDSIANAVDNCPNWPNPAQTLPPWPIPANDPDCDGFSTAVENAASTAPLAHCGANAWPADINSDGYSDITDITQLAANFGEAVPPGPPRQNIAPDPVDGFIDITDITKIAGFFGKSCV